MVWNEAAKSLTDAVFCQTGKVPVIYAKMEGVDKDS
jgi:hypothetical protein